MSTLSYQTTAEGELGFRHLDRDVATQLRDAVGKGVTGWRNLTP